jgi:hypothetical protein
MLKDRATFLLEAHDGWWIETDRYQWLSDHELMITRFPDGRYKFYKYDIETHAETPIDILSRVFRKKPKNICNWSISPDRRWVLCMTDEAATVVGIDQKSVRRIEYHGWWDRSLWLQDSLQIGYYQASRFQGSNDRIKGVSIDDGTRSDLIEVTAENPMYKSYIRDMCSRNGALFAVIETSKTPVGLSVVRMELNGVNASWSQVNLSIPEDGEIQSATFSTDCKQISFLIERRHSDARYPTWVKRIVPYLKENPYVCTELWICAADGKVATLVGHYRHSVDTVDYPLGVVWKPDGKSITFWLERKLYSIAAP